MNPPTITFTVYGIPVPKGNKTGYVKPHTYIRAKNGAGLCVGGQAHLVEARRADARERFEAWETAVVHAAIAARMRNGMPRFDCATNVCARFFFPRPEHETIAQRARIYKTTKPDYDKLIRAILDPMQKAALLAEDSRVVSTDGGAKLYVPYTADWPLIGAEVPDRRPRAEITVSALPP